MLHDYTVSEQRPLQHYRELRVYQSAFTAACEIHHLSKSFPGEERYSLTDQVRRSSRAVCATIAEAWQKRRYPNHFVSKLSDADAECAETQTWLDFADAFGYIEHSVHKQLRNTYLLIGKQLGTMMAHPEQWTPKTVI